MREGWEKDRCQGSMKKAGNRGVIDTEEWEGGWVEGLSFSARSA